MSGRARVALRIAVGIGGAIDASVAALALFFPWLLGPLLDVPAHDPALATIAGAETAIAAGVYVALLRDLDRFRSLLYLVALDQSFAVLVPALEIARGHLAASLKTLGPLPFSAALAVWYLYGARRLASPQDS